VLGLVKAFLKAGVLSEDGIERDTLTGTPQGGILSPLLSNIALSVLDEHFAAAWEAMGDSHAREQRRRKGLANYKLVRYADDFVVLVAGDRAHAESLRAETAAVLSPIGLSLSVRKTTIAHIDEGFDFLGFRIRRHKKRGTAKAPRLHLPLAGRVDGRERKGAGAHRGIDTPTVSDPAAPAQPGAARLDQLVPSRGIE
jgi:RNA-directed DNA polymerase